MLRTYKNFNPLTPIGVYNQLGLVIDGCDGNTNYPNLPWSVADMKTQQPLLNNAIINAQTGGPEEKAIRDNLVTQTINGLRKNASYVDIHCNDDMAILLSSGFEPVSTNRAQYPLDPPTVLGVDNVGNGQLRARVKGQPTVKSYVGQIKEVGAAEWGPAISFASSRKIIFDGLKAGVTYVIQLLAIGGSNGQSDWSDPAQKMSM